MIPEAALSSFIAAMFSMMNPIGNVGVFAGMTAQRPGNEVRRTAWTSAGAIAVTLLIVTWPTA
jgi:multiple antibiotic resistance protein